MDGYKVMFENLRQTSIEPLGRPNTLAKITPDPAAIGTALRTYINSIGESGLVHFEPTAEDRELIDRLNSLGYLDNEPTPSN